MKVGHQLIEESCVESHEEFMNNNKFLWLNKEYFIKIPFKKKINLNPIKANHSGISLKHHHLTKKECEELLEFGLIKPSDS